MAAARALLGQHRAQAFAASPLTAGYHARGGDRRHPLAGVPRLAAERRTWVDGQVQAFAGAEVSDSKYLALTSEGPSGGPGGSPFDDSDLGNFIRSPYPLPGPTLAGSVQIASVTVFSGVYIDSIQVTYAPSEGITGQPEKHGGGGGHPQDLLLQPGEYITEVSGRSGDYVDSLTIRTGGSRSQTMTWGGSGGSRSFDYKAPPGTEIVFCWGRSGQYLDAIGVDTASPVSNPPPPNPNAFNNNKWSGYVAEPNFSQPQANSVTIHHGLMDRSDGRPAYRPVRPTHPSGWASTASTTIPSSKSAPKKAWLTASPSITHGGRCSPPGRSSRSNAST